jgi:hypothetical protein
VGLGGFEPPTSPLSGVRSNQLSYRPGDTVCRSGSKELQRHGRYTAKLLDQVICADAHASDCDAVSLKEVIQPQVPLGLPCYDFTPVMNHKVVSALPKVKLPTSFATHSHGVTGGVYKARERIHRDILIRDY